MDSMTSEEWWLGIRERYGVNHEKNEDEDNQ